MSNASGRLVGEETLHATIEDAAHWIAVYTELLSFKAELLEITAKRRVTMSEDARREAEDDYLVLGAQADKYTRRLREWSAHPGRGIGAPTVHARQGYENAVPVEELRALTARLAELSSSVAAALVDAEADAAAAEASYGPAPEGTF